MFFVICYISQQVLIRLTDASRESLTCVVRTGTGHDDILLRLSLGPCMDDRLSRARVYGRRMSMREWHRYRMDDRIRMVNSLDDVGRVGGVADDDM